MRKEYKDKFPAWCNDYFFVDYELILSDDLDSLISCCLLEEEFGYKINYFYDFKNVYIIDNTGSENVIGVDIDFISGRCWSNHVTLLNPNDRYNSNSANLNNIEKINRDNYHNKFCGSTLLQIWSYYDIPLPKTDEGKMLLLAIDSGFLGHYNNRFKKTHTQWLEILEFEELIDILKKYEEKDFINIHKEYTLNRNIYINKNGYLETTKPLDDLQGFFDFEIKLPTKQFELLHEFEMTSCALDKYKTYNKGNIRNPVSVALIYKNRLNFTYKSA